MIAAVTGLVFAVGVLLVLTPILGVPRLQIRPPRWYLSWSDLITRARIRGLTPGRLIGTSLGVVMCVFACVFLWTQVLSVSLIIGAICAPLPSMIVAARSRARVKKAREAWPEVIDSLVSGVRAGAGLPELLAELAENGPEELRPAFGAFAADYRAEGRFETALSRLKDRLADPVADRIVEALKLARDLGGANLSLLLRDLGVLLREDSRIRGELEARQSWTVNAARLAVAAPWIVLVMISAQPQAAKVWNSPGGILVLLVGAGLCIIAYLVMKTLGRLSTDPRTMR